MRVSAVFLLFLGLFFGLMGLVYWFWAYEDGGAVMLLGATLLGFLPGGYYFFWYRRFHGHEPSSGARSPSPASVPPTGWTPRWRTERATSTRSPAPPSGPSSWVWVPS